MKKALHTFTLTEERSSWETTSYTEPYVSSVFRVDKPVHYNRVDGYIRFTSLQANANVKMIGNGTPNVEYSRNYYDWEDWDFSTVTLANEGDKVWFRGVNPSGFNHDVSTTGDCRNFVSTGKTSLDGNIMTLLYGQKALGDYSLEIKENESGRCFANLFSGNTGLTGEIELPSPTAPNRCYYGLLRDCTLWDYAPALPASENLGVYCYFTTLSNTAIEEAPELPAMKIPEGGYDAMFYYCKKLKKAPYLPATEIDIRAYRAMFQGCSAMTETQDVLPAENVPASGYMAMYNSTAIEKAPEMEMNTVGQMGCYGMFNQCSKLVDPPTILKPMSLSLSAYSGMFGSCSKLSKAPLLPATSFSQAGGVSGHQYDWMFQYCTSLVDAPNLPATSLSPFCYHNMFMGCTALKNTHPLPATAPTRDSYSNMFSGCTSLEEAPYMAATSFGVWAAVGMFNTCTSLTKPADILETGGSGGYRGAFEKMYANCKSLKKGCLIKTTNAGQQDFVDFYRGCTALEEVPDLKFTAVAATGCTRMFYGCTALKKAPRMPAMENPNRVPLTNNFLQMFYGCTSLEEAPIIKMSGISTSFQEIYRNCTSLKKIYWLGKGQAPSFPNWVAGVPSGGTFYVDPDKTWTETYGVNAIPEGWTVQNYES